jgi:hypothetical protein
MASTAAQPVVLVTNDDGIDAPGLRFLVDQLVAQGRYRVLVCAPDTSVLLTPPHPRDPPLLSLLSVLFLICLLLCEDSAAGTPEDA